MRHAEIFAECFHPLALPFVEKSVVVVEQVRHGHLQELRYPGKLVQWIGIPACVLVADVGAAVDADMVSHFDLMQVLLVAKISQPVSRVGYLVGACASEIESDGITWELRAQLGDVADVERGAYAVAVVYIKIIVYFGMELPLATTRDT